MADENKEPADSCHWTATSTHGVDTVEVTVKGVCQEPTPGYKLSLIPVTIPGTDPNILFLYFDVVAPTGIGRNMSHRHR